MNQGSRWVLPYHMAEAKSELYGGKGKGTAGREVKAWVPVSPHVPQSSLSGLQCEPVTQRRTQPHCLFPLLQLRCGCSLVRGCSKQTAGSQAQFGGPGTYLGMSAAQHLGAVGWEKFQLPLLRQEVSQSVGTETGVQPPHFNPDSASRGL